MSESVSPLRTPPDWPIVAKWAAGAALAGSVLALELTGHAPAGTFLTTVAVPGFAVLGLHVGAKTLT